VAALADWPKLAATIPARATSEPADKSIPLDMIINVKPKDMIPYIAL